MIARTLSVGTGEEVGIFDPDTPKTNTQAKKVRTTASPVDLPEVVSGSNPLVKASNHLLNLIPQLRATTDFPEPAVLRTYLIEQLGLFEKRARESGVSEESIIGARYCLCTALDETAAQTPWGGSGIWPRYSLLVKFHNETWGGEKFFMLLSRLAQNPQQHHDLLELMYFCIALGFEGRYRIMDNGRTQLDTVKRRLADILKKSQGEYAKSLSLRWRGVDGVIKRIFTMLPIWVATAAVALIGLGIYLWLAYALSNLTDPLFLKISSIRMPRITLVQTKPAVAPRLAKFLEPEIREGLVSVRDEMDRSVIILRGDGMFNPGSNTVLPRYIPVLGRVADALNMTKGAVLVTGYTDNLPIRTLRFPSNWHLSEARSLAVRQILEPSLTQRGRLRSEGKADAEPVAPNDSAANRAKNRRVEVTLLIPPGERDLQLGSANAQ